MQRFSTSRSVLIALAGTLTFLGTGCSTNNSTNHQINIDNTPLVALKNTPAAPTTSLKLQKIEPNQFDMALDKASGALAISQSAQSPDDWGLVASQWNEAIALMKSVPASSPNKAIAQKKLVQYQQNLSYAQQQASRPVQMRPERVAAISQNQPTSSSDRLPVQAPSLPVPPSQKVFQALIKSRNSGTPVIDVTFNGIEQFEMIVDTGASGTVITQQMASALGVVPVGKTKANTASARNVEFAIGYINSIEVGGAVIQNIPVAIAPSADLEMGLLGQDFFSNYDVTIKRDVVEFRTR